MMFTLLYPQGDMINGVLCRSRVITQRISKRVLSGKVLGGKISKYQHSFNLVKMTSSCTTDIVKSLNDKREYR